MEVYALNLWVPLVQLIRLHVANELICWPLSSFLQHIRLHVAAIRSNLWFASPSCSIDCSICCKWMSKPLICYSPLAECIRLHVAHGGLNLWLLDPLAQSIRWHAPNGGLNCWFVSPSRSVQELHVTNWGLNRRVASPSGSIDYITCCKYRSNRLIC